MHTRLLTTFSALLLAVCLLSACGVNAPFDAKEIAFEPVQSVQDPTPVARILPVGDASRTLAYQYDETTLSGETWEVFEAEDGTQAKYCKQNASVSVTAGQDSAIADTSESLAGEEDYLAHVQEWVRLLAPDADLSAYTYACTTSYLKRDGEEPAEYWISETADDFYRPQNKDEKIDGYLFTYTQMANGFATENGITVETDGKGNLLAFRYDCYDTDWTFSITDKALADTVDAFIDARGKKDSHRTTNVEILEKHLAIVEGEVQLSVTVTATCTPRDPSIEVAYRESFSLYLSPKKEA